MRRGVLAAVLLVAACEKKPDAPNQPTRSNPSGNPLTASGALTVPRALEAKFHSSQGPSWSVTMEGMGAVGWRYAAQGDRGKARFGTVMIPVERWKVFREALEDAGAFDLNKGDVGADPEAGDWSFSVDFGDKRVKAEGLKGGPNDARLSKIFAAVNMLVDGKLR
jgi:hypothetical protein